MVEEEIVNYRKIKGKITSIISIEKSSELKEYFTEYFKIKVLFENGLMPKATKIGISER